MGAGKGIKSVREPGKMGGKGSDGSSGTVLSIGPEVEQSLQYSNGACVQDEGFRMPETEGSELCLRRLAAVRSAGVETKFTVWNWRVDILGLTWLDLV
jgi:hypothetical protein